MNDLIIKRQILRLFATAGSESDFVQFMLINGNVISIWEIVQYALNTNLGLSASMGGETSQGVVLTIPDRPKIYAANTYDVLDKPNETPEIAAWNRSHNVNSVINSARIYADLHINKLAQSYHSI